MTVSEKVQAVLEAAATVTALVPASRIRVPGNDQNIRRPYILHFPTGMEPQYTYAGLSTFRYWDYYQVSIFADSLEDAEAAFSVVRDALAGNHDGTYIWIQPGAGYAGAERTAGGLVIHHFVLNVRIRESL